MRTIRSNRREFLKNTAVGGLAMLAAGAAASASGQTPEGSPDQPNKVFLPVVGNNALSFRPEPEYLNHMKKMVEDPDFATAWEALDLQRVADNLGGFSDAISQYNVFHTRERRLWYVQIGSGKVPPQLEAKFKEDIPAGIENYTAAFGAVSNCITALEESGFHTLLDRYGDDMTQFLSNENSYLGRTVSTFFADAGCSTEMFAEFQGAFEPANFRLIETVGGGSFSKFRGTLQESVDAQVSILDYTRENGFSYLRGKCGPPKWAVVVTQVLAWAGISISAWVVVVIIVALIATLVTICALEILPPKIQDKCRYLRYLGIPVGRW